MCTLPMKRYSYCITSTAYTTNDTTRIHHDYKPDFSSMRSFLPRPEVGSCLTSNRRPRLFNDYSYPYCQPVILHRITFVFHPFCTSYIVSGFVSQPYSSFRHCQSNYLRKGICSGSLLLKTDQTRLCATSLIEILSNQNICVSPVIPLDHTKSWSSICNFEYHYILVLHLGHLVQRAPKYTIWASVDRFQAFQTIVFQTQSVYIFEVIMENV